MNPRPTGLFFASGGHNALIDYISSELTVIATSTWSSMGAL